MSATASSVWRRLRRVLLSLPVLIVAGLFVFYVAFGYLAVGPLAEHYIPKLAQSRLDSRATVGKVAFDPLHLNLTVDQLQLSTPQGVPLAGFGKLFVDFAPVSLFRWAWTFHQIRVDQPQVNVAIAQGGAMNWDALVRALQRGPKPAKPSDTLPRVVIEQLQIAGGTLRYADANRPHPYATQLTPLNVQVNDLSTLPKARGQYAISLVLPEQKATLRWKGYVGVNPLVSGGQAELTGLDLAAAARAVPNLSSSLQITSGTASIHAAYSAVQGQQGWLWAINDLGAQIQTLAARVGAAAVQWQSLKLDGAKIDGAKRTVSMQSLSLDGLSAASGSDQLQFHTAQLQGGQLDWGRQRSGFGPLRVQDISGQIGQAALQAGSLQTQPGTVDLAQRTLQLPQITLQNSQLRAEVAQAAPWLSLPMLQVDAVQADLAQRRLQLGAVQLDAARVQLKRLANGQIDLLQAMSASKASKPPSPPASVPASVPTSAPASAVQAAQPAPAWTLEVQRVATRVQALDYTDQSFKAPLQLQLSDLKMNSAAKVVLPAGSPAQVQAKDLQLQLGAMQLDSARQALARWKSLQLGSSEISLPASGVAHIRAGALQVDGFNTEVTLAQNGLNWAQAFVPASATRASAAPRPAKPAAQNPAAKLPDLQLKSLALRDFSAQVEDRQTSAPLRLDVVQGQASARNLSLDLRKPVALQVRFALKQGGQFSARGQVVPQPLAGSLQVQLQQLALTPYGSLLAPYVRLLLTSGTASADGTVKLGKGQGSVPKVSYDGRAQIDNLALVEPEGRTPFLGWRKLAATGLSVDSAPLSVSINALQAVEPYGRIVINPDRTLNVQAILLTRKAAQSPPPAAVGHSAEKPLPLALRIDRTAIENADVDFTDQSIKPDFRVRMQKLSGVINGLSDAPDSSAQIELDGQVNDYGSAKVRGQLQPFRATQNTDVTLDFRNLNMASVSPYSGKFAGRTIESGRLDAKLQYKIVKAQMQGNNQFTITRLKLGPHVDSPGAMNLPLDLAIAVLENSDGVIDIDLPVHGDLNNPKFSYGGIIWQAIVNVLTKIVTAPFRALGALFGGGGEQTSQNVAFAPGSAVLAPPEREKLLHIAEALRKRPRLELQVPPTLDVARDTAALQQAAVRRQVLLKLGVTVPPDVSPGPLDLGNARTRNAITALYLDQHPTSALDALKKSLPKTDQPEQALLHAMLAQLAKAVVIPQSALDALAQARAKAVVTALTTGPKALPATRVQTGTAIKAAEKTADKMAGNGDEKDQEKDVVLTLGLASGQATASAPSGVPTAAPTTSPTTAPQAPAAASVASAAAAQGK
ncbi:DUF748 domain-containing protein [Thiomonas arsenitoxydans]|uniref:DUF748 domain-containing protein n=1 Tax=Thiomonas arsenitoxydans (strain DSM 22701 / CIP 110005 / 3As) TaxID=426114 RepID=UPI001AD5E012|nr:DUF748 domain-containing protein [Thiomonas arsenitoxydans]MBN8776601.1 DUF748 domain-containing protein [Thiomonas arsenitoxydans]